MDDKIPARELLAYRSADAPHLIGNVHRTYKNN